MKKRRSTFAILCYLNKAKIKKNGMCPIMGRITIDTKIAQFSTKLEIQPNLWDGKLGRAIGQSRHAKAVNKRIDKLRIDAGHYHASLTLKEGYVTAQMIKNALLGIHSLSQEYGLLKEYALHNQEFEKRIGINRVKASALSYRSFLNHLKGFVQNKLGRNDIPFKEFDLTLIAAYERYLLTEHNLHPSTVRGELIALHKIVKRAIYKEVLYIDPFDTYKLKKRPDSPRKYLSLEEMEELIFVELESDTLRHTRDLFVFSMFTGIAYADLKQLSKEHLKIDLQGNTWIIIDRQKTGTQSVVKLLEIPRKIIEKYKHEQISDKLFKVKSNLAIQEHLKKIAALCKIQKGVTFHMARHTYATQICLSNGIPLETISQMLGHKAITTTQIYAQVTAQKIKQEMGKLSESIDGTYQIPNDKMPIGIDTKYRK